MQPIRCLPPASTSCLRSRPPGVERRGRLSPLFTASIWNIRRIYTVYMGIYLSGQWTGHCTLDTELYFVARITQLFTQSWGWLRLLHILQLFTINPCVLPWYALAGGAWCWRSQCRVDLGSDERKPPWSVCFQYVLWFCCENFSSGKSHTMNTSTWGKPLFQHSPWQQTSASRPNLSPVDSYLHQQDYCQQHQGPQFLPWSPICQFPSWSPLL